MSADLWNNDEVQFARLIAEMEAYGVFEGMHDWHGLFESTDLDEDAVCELIDRAQLSFEKSKAQLPGAPVLPPIALGDTVQVYTPEHPSIDGKTGTIEALPGGDSYCYHVRLSTRGFVQLYDSELTRL